MKTVLRHYLDIDRHSRYSIEFNISIDFLFAFTINSIWGIELTAANRAIETVGVLDIFNIGRIDIKK